MLPILVIDDDPMICDLVQTALEDAGYPVVFAGDGQEALQLLETVIPSLILLDLRMPLVDGWTFWEEYSRRHPRAPVVVFTASSPRIEADDLLLKPFDLGDLLALVQRWIGPATNAEPAPDAPGRP